jgi:hypothetical protein
MEELKEKELLDKARTIWDDTIKEKDVVKKIGVSAKTLKLMRKDGRIKNYRYVMASQRDKCQKPKKIILYSLSELVEIFCPTELERKD